MEEKGRDREMLLSILYYRYQTHRMAPRQTYERLLAQASCTLSIAFTVLPIYLSVYVFLYLGDLTGPLVHKIRFFFFS